MKAQFTLILMAILFFSVNSVTAQGVAINDDGSPANSSAQLDVQSTTKGFLPPRMTEQQRNAITSPATGLIIYQTDGTTGLYHYNGSAWSVLQQPPGTKAGEMQYWDGSAWIAIESAKEGQFLHFKQGAPVWVTLTGVSIAYPPTVSTNEVSDIYGTGATCGGNVTGSGNLTVTARGVCYSTSPNPTTADSYTSNGSGTGSFTSSLTGLSEYTTYYVRAYATNSEGTAYGSEKEFATAPALPTLTTTSVSNITYTTATSGGNITFEGGTVTARGVCWSTSSGPTTADSKTSDGTGTGSFTSSLTGLTYNKTYYVRAYATNSEGTAYGDEKTFSTPVDSWGRDETTQVVDVTSLTGRKWMDRNLGASQVADGLYDSDAYGDLYQWGREADGHETRNSSTTTTLSNSDSPGHDDFITTSASPYDWRSPQNRNLWQGDGVNNPCPHGYRLPTQAEWQEEMATWSAQTGTGGINSALKLPQAGRRNNMGSSWLGWAHYWTSTTTTTDAKYLYLESNEGEINIIDRVYAGSVRCIKIEDN